MDNIDPLVLARILSVSLIILDSSFVCIANSDFFAIIISLFFILTVYDQ